MKKSLITLIFTLFFGIILGQSDPLNLVSNSNGKDLYDIQKYSIGHWNEVYSKYLDKERAEFFFINDPISFYDYLNGCYEFPWKSERYKEANYKAETIILLTNAFSSDPEMYRSELEDLYEESRDFYTVRYCDLQRREDLYKAYKYLSMVHK